MATFVIPNRPFATEPITGMMTPDGIFEAAIGRQTINAHVQSSEGTASNVQVYLESVSDPGIVVTPLTHIIADTAPGAPHLVSWQTDFSMASPGKHLVSFVVIQPGGRRQRIITKIFVTKMAFNAATGGYSITSPEGTLNMVVTQMVGPAHAHCQGGSLREEDCIDGTCRMRHTINGVLQTAATLAKKDGNKHNLLQYLAHGMKLHDPDFVLCAPQVLLSELETTVTPMPPFAGQYGDLPFQDPWWKVLLIILAALLLIAAVIAEALDGTGSLTVGTGTGGTGTSGTPGCCPPIVSGSGTSGVAAGLLAGAAAAAALAVYSDARDPFRKGQDNTMPRTDTELTVAEKLTSKITYGDDIIPGKPFTVSIDYKYSRTTTAETYTHEAQETNTNVHLLERYVIDAPDVVRAYRHEPFTVKAQFYQTEEVLYMGSQLLVQCFLIGPAGQRRIFTLEDNGVTPDTTPVDGTYTGVFHFSTKEKGLWKYYVLAQDVNTADPGLEPEDAAQIIGGVLLTDQLHITFSGGTCPLVADGDVNVVG